MFVAWWNLETWIAPVILTPKASEWKNRDAWLATDGSAKSRLPKRKNSSLVHHLHKFKTPTDHICRDEVMDNLMQQIGDQNTHSLVLYER